MIPSILLLSSIAALSIVSMDLALACVYARRANRHAWTNYFIVFLATALGLVFSEILASWSSIIFTGKAEKILYIIFESLKKADGSFMMVFVPLFSSWVIAYPLSSKAKVFFFLVAAAYLTSSILYFIFPEYEILDRLSYNLVIFDLLYVNFVMLTKSRGIENRGIKLVVYSIMATCFPLLAIALIGTVVPQLRSLMIILCVLGIAIVILVFLFIAFSKKEQDDVMHLKKELSIDDLKQYGITGREFDVILLIREGLTAKEIASQLTISVNTVNNHIANIFSKTGVRSRIDLLNLIQDIW